ncbi:hypothetical protein B0H16DRAFT_1604715 [Mycena metata]|uniref:Uncharacterized protein n=1 Tax=Mycena metata TaxID=1033252 RepID=A0AAD7MJG9_9AGAR|nr:hypothetical protein B0H16DRAFT_1604715 [Mycena metata]
MSGSIPPAFSGLQERMSGATPVPSPSRPNSLGGPPRRHLKRGALAVAHRRSLGIPLVPPLPPFPLVPPCLRVASIWRAAYRLQASRGPIPLPLTFRAREWRRRVEPDQKRDVPLLLSPIAPVHRFAVNPLRAHSLLGAPSATTPPPCLLSSLAPCAPNSLYLTLYPN